MRVGFGDLGPLTCGNLRTAYADVWFWILSEGDLKLLEDFQGEMVKLPKHFSNTATVTTLDWPSMRVRQLLKKITTRAIICC